MHPGQRLTRPAGKCDRGQVRRWRKAMVEPVIGSLKQQRRLRQFLRRGLRNVQTEWLLAAISHHLTRCHRLLA